MTEIYRPPYLQGLSAAGLPLSGAKLYFYEAGTTNEITIYQDDGLTTPHTNPVIADSAGVFPPIYLNAASYKTVLTTSADVTVQTVDDIIASTAVTSVLDSQFRIQDEGDTTKQAAFQASGISTGTTRTYTLPDKNGTLATTDDIVSVEAASNAEVLAGAVDDKYVSPATAYFSTGHLYGLTLSNNSTDATNDIDIAAGTARDGSDTVNMVLASALTKRLDAAWAVGTNQGMLDGSESVAGTPDASTWYHLWLIKRSDTGVVDVLASESATAPTMPTNYDYKRRIGAVYNDSSGNILAFHQDGDDFWWKTPRQDATTTVPTTSTAVTLSVPSGISVVTNLVASLVGASTGQHYLRVFSPEETDAAAGTTNANLIVESSAGVVFGVARTPVRVKTNTSSQVQVRGTSTSTSYTLNTLGWTDKRGRV